MRLNGLRVRRGRLAVGAHGAHGDAVVERHPADRERREDCRELLRRERRADGGVLPRREVRHALGVGDLARVHRGEVGVLFVSRGVNDAVDPGGLGG